MSAILDLNSKIEESLLTDRNLEQKVFVELSKMVSSAYQHAMQQTELGYCFKFNLPIIPVSKKLYKLIGIDNKDTFNAFKKDWGADVMRNRMHKDPYYQILLMLIYYGLKHKKIQIAENALFILLMKIWNGRREHYLPSCYPEIMNYVISRMNKKYIAGNFDGPLFVIKDYFIPTILKKYSSNVLRNPSNKEGLKRMFEQCWSRVAQMWAQNTQVNLQTGKKEKTGGFLPLYIKAKNDGSALSTKVGDVENEINYMSVNEREEISQDIADFITTNTNKKYSDNYINSLYRKSNVKIKMIRVIIDGMHNYTLYDQIQETIILILSRLNINQKEDICKSDIYSRLRKNVISSKNNVEVQKIRRLCNYILNKIFEKNQININIEKDYTPPTQVKFRSLLLELILVDMKKVICHQQIVGKSNFKMFNI